MKAASIITKIEKAPAAVQVDEAYDINPMVLDLNCQCR